MAPLRHFITGDFEKRTVFLPDKEYGLALDALVKGCADVLITSGAGPSLRILLGKRRVEPQPDWWFVGGRTRPGDTPAEGAARNVKRELGLALDPARFAAVGTYSFVWRLRAQAPATNGTADVSTVFELHLADDEAADLSPAPTPRSTPTPPGRPDAVLAGDYHPALQQAVRDLLARRAYGALRDAAADASAGAAPSRRRGGARLARVRADGRCKVRFEDGAYVFRWGLAVLGLAAFVAGRYSARG
ncbi:hypothetical protein JL722_12843 [Aureococcus anophagefferens]|nr:hypothetical protein JL722_12843 [Aureococcus anophagefferens]